MAQQKQTMKKQDRERYQRIADIVNSRRASREVTAEFVEDIATGKERAVSHPVIAEIRAELKGVAK